MSDFLSSEKAFSLFFKHHYKTACIIAFRYLDDVEKAEDLVQDVFRDLWEKGAKYSVQGDGKAYLLMMIKNRCINFIQREQRAILPISEEILDESEDLTCNEELSIKISYCINKLPPRCQEIFRLAYLSNYSYQEIADELAISKNSVKTQMGIAYRILREELKSWAIDLFSLFYFMEKNTELPLE